VGTGRGDAAAATWILRGRVAATPWLHRGYFVDRGGFVAATCPQTIRVVAAASMRPRSDPSRLEIAALDNSSGPGAGSCEWHKCSCKHGTPHTGETIGVVSCGGDWFKSCGPTRCDDGVTACHHCDEGYWVDPGYWRHETPQGDEGKCIKCDHNTLKSHDVQCKCVLEGQKCGSDEDCCGDNICWNKDIWLSEHEQCRPAN